MTTAILAQVSSTQRSFGLVIAVLVFVGFVVYLFINIRQSRAEVGSEIELAANRKPYFSDEELEGVKLDRSLTWGLALLVIAGISVPLYWLAEPGRQAGAVQEFDRIFTARGERNFASTADGGLGCAGCHGPNGVGGSAPHTLTAADGSYIDSVSWKAPALNTIYERYDREEVRWILNFGRPFSPMQAWGTPGGGPLTEQQVDNLLDYLESIQLSDDELATEVSELIAAADETGLYSSPGEMLFNLGLNSDAAAGAYSCGRCHTPGWSYGQPENPGGGAYGPSLVGVSSTFSDKEQMIDFIASGTEEGQTYGNQGIGQGGGQMPGFETIFTREQIAAIVDYEWSLTGDEPSPGFTIGGQPLDADGTDEGSDSDADEGAEEENDS